jgi:hypothetical protein
MKTVEISVADTEITDMKTTGIRLIMVMKAIWDMVHPSVDVTATMVPTEIIMKEVDTMRINSVGIQDLIGDDIVVIAMKGTDLPTIGAVHPAIMEEIT